MTLDRQVLVIAFLALSLKLYLWGIETDGVEANDELHQDEAFNPDFDGPRLRARARSAALDGPIVTTPDFKVSKR